MQIKQILRNFPMFRQKFLKKVAHKFNLCAIIKISNRHNVFINLYHICEKNGPECLLTTSGRFIYCCNFIHSLNILTVFLFSFVGKWCCNDSSNFDTTCFPSFFNATFNLYPCDILTCSSSVP